MDGWRACRVHGTVARVRRNHEERAAGNRDGITVIEWPEYYMNFLPQEYLEIDFKEISDEEREILFVSLSIVA